jgi:NAD(P)-dependent dehydrogenase (short-subunit alcohol dehydrogenase family)
MCHELDIERNAMRISGSVALVTGADRGLGRVYARELVSRGAAKVYGGARKPAAVTEPGLTPIGLDITDPDRVAQIAAECGDVSLLVNNAGVMKASSFVGTPTLDPARLEMETNYFGTLSMCRAFAPALRANGGGAIVNMLSVTSFYTNPLDASYGASKAAAWSVTNGIRIELHHQGTLVVAVHASFIDTDMAAGIDAPKVSPESVARQAFDAVEADQIEVLADERSRFVKASLSRDHELIYPDVQAFWDAMTGTTQATS